jgi:hypothetical protein
LMLASPAVDSRAVPLENGTCVSLYQDQCILKPETVVFMHTCLNSGDDYSVIIIIIL